MDQLPSQPQNSNDVTVTPENNCRYFWEFLEGDSSSGEEEWKVTYIYEEKEHEPEPKL